MGVTELYQVNIIDVPSQDQCRLGIKSSEFIEVEPNMFQQIVIQPRLWGTVNACTDELLGSIDRHWGSDKAPNYFQVNSSCGAVDL